MAREFLFAFFDASTSFKDNSLRDRLFWSNNSFKENTGPFFASESSSLVDNVGDGIGSASSGRNCIEMCLDPVFSLFELGRTICGVPSGFMNALAFVFELNTD